MASHRPRLLVLVFAVAAVFCTGCSAPVALAEVVPSGFQDLIRGLPTGGERVELLIDGQTVLRGAYVPPAPGAPVVLHFLESGGSIARGKGGRLEILHELADLGLGSLMLDWSGVGVSAGIRANQNLRRDASVMWREALRRVDGDPGRILIRSASLGTLAAAGLLERGAKPGGVILIAPVRAETAHRNYARARYGAFFGGTLTAGMGKIADIDLVAAIKNAPCPLLVLQADGGDLFVTPAEQAEIETATSAVTTRFGGLPGDHIEAVLRAQSLLDQELAWLEEWIPPLSDASARASLMQMQMPGGAIPSSFPEEKVQRLLMEIAPFTRTQPSERIVAAALASERVRNGLRLLWLVEEPDGDLPRRYDDLDTGELVDVFSLRDPAGELPIDLIAALRVPFLIVDRLGGALTDFDPMDMPAMAWSGGAGIAGGSWSSGMDLKWIGEETFVFDHAVLWRQLLQRGLGPRDARRQMVRVMLMAYGFAHRLRASSQGDWVLEYWKDGAWVPLDLETPPTNFHPPFVAVKFSR